MQNALFRRHVVPTRILYLLAAMTLGMWMFEHVLVRGPNDNQAYAQESTTSSETSTVNHSPGGESTEKTVHTNTDDDHTTSEHSEGEHSEGEHGGEEHSGGGGHQSPITPILAGLTIILGLAKIGGDLFERIKLPAVLGELVVGVVIGNFAMLTGGIQVFNFLHAPAEHTLGDPYSAGAVLKMLSEIGVLILLFEVGLESNIHQMMSVGVSSFLVAILGVVAPILLGWGVGHLLIPQEGWEVHMFLGAALCATSVGITARVLKDLGQSKARESKIILGAAVIDDVLGLIVLAVAQGIILTGSVDPGNIGIICGKAFGFLIGAILLGTMFFTRPLFIFANKLHGHGLLVVTSLIICFVFSYFAGVAGLAPIVGAFAAGLILEEVHYRELKDKEGHKLEDAIHPIGALLIPIFFVEMGIGVNLSSFADSSVWGLAAALTFVAILGKQVCALGVTEKGLNKMAVGLGMIPRGEVGLIFAAVGKSLRTKEGHDVISDSTFSAIVVMVMITTMVTPPLLKWGMGTAPTGPDEGTGQDKHLSG